MLRLFLVLAFFVSCSKQEVPGPAPIPAPSDEAYVRIAGANGKVYHTGLLQSLKRQNKLGATHVKFADCDNLPDSFDLRPLGLVPPVRDQGNCGSCWSFSKTGSLESALLGIGKSLDLSEQELVSCDREQYGCGGGNLSDFRYQIKTGQSLESEFPYTASDSRCKSSGLSDAYKGVSFVYVGSPGGSPTEKELQCALYKGRTIPWITVSASGGWGSPPSSENVMYSRCGRGQTNHAVGVVGWKTINGKLGFIMKNSWGKSWGADGYMVLPLGCDSFGEEVAYIQVQQPPVPPTPTPTPTPTPPGPTPTPTPTPGPCKPPYVKLPSNVQIELGSEVQLGVKPMGGVFYQWFASGVMVGAGNILYASPEADTVYKLQASNSCGMAESSVQVKVVKVQK